MNPFFFVTSDPQPNTTYSATIGALVEGQVVYQSISIPINQDAFSWDLTSYPVCEVKLFDQSNHLVAQRYGIVATGTWQLLQMQNDAGGSSLYQVVVNPNGNGIIIMADDLSTLTR